ncbi:MAG: NAD(P)H-dependent oxidoreductase [Candidatus Omnitrophota bacterium]
MKKLLHIVATPRGEDSRTLKVSRVFLEAFIRKNPDCEIDELNLAAENLSSLSLKMISGKYVLLGGKELDDKLKEAWKPIERQIERFLSAEGYLISAPMWNFSIPYSLKHYIDLIIQPKYLFRYTDKGVEGLAKNKKMAVITSRGGDYSPGSAFNSYDFQEPYLRAVFGFVGISDITFINAQPMDALGVEAQNEKIEQAKALAGKMAEGF